MKEKMSISINDNNFLCDDSLSDGFTIVRNLFYSAWTFCAQEYIVVFFNLANATLLLRYGFSTFALFEFSGIIQAVFDSYSKAIRRPLLNFLAENKSHHPEKVADLLQAGYIICGIIAIPSILFWSFSGSILAYTAVSPVLIGSIGLFAFPYVLSILPKIIYDTDMQLLNAMQDKKGLLFFTFLSNLSFILLNFLFVYGYLGMGFSGIVGLSFASLAYTVLNFLALKEYFVFSSDYQMYHLFRVRLEGIWTECKRLMKLSIGPLTDALVKTPLSILIGLVLGSLGEAYVALNSIVCYIYLFLAPLSYSIVLASSVRISECIGAKQFLKAKQYGYYSLVMVGLMSLIFSTAITFGHILLLPLFLKASMIQEISRVFTALIFLSSSLLGGMQIYHLNCLGNLSAYQETLRPSLINAVIMTFLGLPLAYIGAVYFEFGLFGYYGALLISAMTSSVFLTSLWSRVSSQAEVDNQLSIEVPTLVESPRFDLANSKHSFWNAKHIKKHVNIRAVNDTDLHRQGIKI